MFGVVGRVPQSFLQLLVGILLCVGELVVGGLYAVEPLLLDALLLY